MRGLYVGLKLATILFLSQQSARRELIAWPTGLSARFIWISLAIGLICQISYLLNSSIQMLERFSACLGPFDFLVDTGTNTTLIEADLAAELGLVPVDRLSLTTLTGSEPVPRYFLEETRVGSASVPQLEALAGPLQQLRSLDRNIRGSLGMNFLAAFSFRLAYEYQWPPVQVMCDGGYLQQGGGALKTARSEEHTSELQSHL